MSELTEQAIGEADKLSGEYSERIRKFAMQLADHRGASQAVDQDVRDSANQYHRTKRKPRGVAAYLFLTLIVILGGALMTVGVDSFLSNQPRLPDAGTRGLVMVGGLLLSGLAEYFKSRLD